MLGWLVISHFWLRRTCWQANVRWLPDTSPRPVATERVSVDWVGREP
jgi:hypothetical protein